MNYKYNIFLVSIFIFNFNYYFAQKAKPKYLSKVDSLVSIATDKDQVDLKKSFKLLNEAIDLTKKHHDYDKEITIINELSRFTFTYKHDFIEAKSCLDRIKDIAKENNNDPKFIAEYHNSLGVLYFNDRTDRQRANKEFRKAISILEENNLKPNHHHLNNYGIALFTEKKYEEALKYLKLSIHQFYTNQEIDITNKFPIMLNMNIGICYSYLKQPDSCEYYLKKCVDLANEKGVIADIYRCYTYLGVFYQENKKYDLAINTFNEVMNKENEFPGDYHTKAQFYEGIANVMAETNNYKKAYEYREIQHLFEDTIKSFDINKQMLTMEYNLELDSLKQGKKLIELNSKLTKGQLTKKYYLMLLLATIFLSGIGFLLFRIKKTKELNKVTLENEKLEKERLKQEAEIKLLKSQETITSKNIQLSIRDNELEQLKTSLQNHLDKSTDPQFDDLKKFLRLTKSSEKRNEQLKFLDEIVKNTNNIFYKKLKSKHPDLTQSELKLSLLINLNLSSNELMEMFNISLSSLNTKRYRLRKKLNICKSDSLEDYLLNL